MITSRLVNHPFYSTSIWKVSIEPFLNTSRNSLCSGFQTSPSYPLVIVKQNIKLIFQLHHLSDHFFLTPAPLCTSLVWSVKAGLKLLDEVILHQLNHFLPTDLTETACPHEKRKKEAVMFTGSLKGCFFRCRITVVASVDDPAQKTSLT